MSGSLRRLARDLARVFAPRRLPWHLLAIGLTVMFVTSGFDGWVGATAHGTDIRAIAFSAGRIGLWTPIAAPLAMLAAGWLRRDGRLTTSAWENTPQRHNMVVCTLCSCYPWDVLGLPPVWYKSAPYRSRAVMDPRGVLADFGVTLPSETEIRVWDSTAETRFMVLPPRPTGTEGWSEERLASLVTRDCMIRTGLPKRPEEVSS